MKNAGEIKFKKKTTSKWGKTKTFYLFFYLFLQLSYDCKKKRMSDINKNIYKWVGGIIHSEIFWRGEPEDL